MEETPLTFIKSKKKHISCLTEKYDNCESHVVIEKTNILISLWNQKLCAQVM
jgi:hypothetical protein